MDFKAQRSVRSVKSVKSVKSFQEKPILKVLATEDEKALPEFEEFLVTTCSKFQCPYDIIVRKEHQRDDFIKAIGPGKKTKRISIVTPFSVQALKKTEEVIDTDDVSLTTTTTAAVVDDATIVVRSLYDALNRLAEVNLYKIVKVPRILIQVIGILAPLHPQLTKITIKKCNIDVYTIYELSKCLPTTYITEICLDDSPLPEANYATLLDKPSNLRYLSLCRCKINDKVCKYIAINLHHMKPASIFLMVLNLTSNEITDKGAHYFSEALRSNRSLRYLNLSGNRITDEGAGQIFDVLTEYPLTYEETVNKRAQYVKYLVKRHSLYTKILNDLDAKSADESSRKSRRSKSIASPKSRSSTARRKEDETSYVKAKAEMLTGEAIGPYIHPYGKSSVRLTRGFSHCLGNFVLCYLNLAYNNLSYSSLKKILEVVTYQNLTKPSNQAGLIKVVVEGNNLPDNCTEIGLINELLNKNLQKFCGRAFTDSRRKSKGLNIRMSAHDTR